MPMEDREVRWLLYFLWIQLDGFSPIWLSISGVILFRLENDPQMLTAKPRRMQRTSSLLLISVDNELFLLFENVAPKRSPTRHRVGTDGPGTGLRASVVERGGSKSAQGRSRPCLSLRALRLCGGARKSHYHVKSIST